MVRVRFLFTLNFLVDLDMYDLEICLDSMCLGSYTSRKGVQDRLSLWFRKPLTYQLELD